MANKEIDECCGQKPELLSSYPSGKHFTSSYGVYRCEKCKKIHNYEIVICSTGMNPTLYIKI